MFLLVLRLQKPFSLVLPFLSNPAQQEACWAWNFLGWSTLVTPGLTVHPPSMFPSLPDLHGLGGHIPQVWGEV